MKQKEIAEAALIPQKTLAFSPDEIKILQRSLSIYISEICSGLRNTPEGQYRDVKKRNLKDAEDLLEKVG